MRMFENLIESGLIVKHSDESEITSVCAASADDVDKAVAAARKAFKDPSWRDISSTERGDLLYKLSALIEEHKETLATIETWDNGTNTSKIPYIIRKKINLIT